MWNLKKSTCQNRIKMRDSPHQRLGGDIKKCWLKDPKLDARDEKKEMLRKGKFVEMGNQADV